MNISENAKKAAEDIRAFIEGRERCHWHDTMPVDLLSPFIQQAIDLERNATLEEAAKECEARANGVRAMVPRAYFEAGYMPESSIAIDTCESLAARIRSFKKG